MKFDTNNHSVFILYYHLIMCVKYRNKVIDDDISDRLKEIFEYIAPKIRRSLWKEMFWSQSYCLMSTGGVTVDIIKQYIQSQGEK